MPIEDFREGQLERLSDPEYSALYLNAALEEFDKDGDVEAFLIALRNVVDAMPDENQSTTEKADISRLLSGEENQALIATLSKLKAFGISVSFKASST